MAGSALIIGASNGGAQQSAGADAVVPTGASLYLIIEWTEDTI